MKTLTLKRLAPCIVVAVVALAATSADGQEVTYNNIATTSTNSSSASSYVGDSSTSDGQIVAVDGVCVGCGRNGCNGTSCGTGPASGCQGQGCNKCNGLGCGANGVFAPGCAGCGLGIVGAGGQGMDMTMRDRSYGRPDLFYNFYTQGYANRANAQMYLSPVPVPPNVGHTFYTYQPFMPHHMMYPHVDRFHRYYDGGRGTNQAGAGLAGGCSAQGCAQGVNQTGSECAGGCCAHGCGPGMLGTHAGCSGGCCLHGHGDGGGRGMNRTRAVYWTSAHAKVQNFYWNFLRLPR